MKNNYLSHSISAFFPRSKNLSFSKVLPHLFIFAVLLLLACTIHVPGQQLARNFVPGGDRPAPREMAINSMERRVFDLVNEERVKHGLRPVVWVEGIANVARYHSKNMAANDFFAHVDPQGRKAGKRSEQMGISNWKQVSENIAWLTGSDPAARVVRCWMQSPGHRDNILDPVSKESGIGLAIAPDGKYYFTQVFMLRK